MWYELGLAELPGVSVSGMRDGIGQIVAAFGATVFLVGAPFICLEATIWASAYVLGLPALVEHGAYWISVVAALVLFVVVFRKAYRAEVALRQGAEPPSWWEGQGTGV
ncbi:MAG: hypothetical protein GC150_10010 [Rhizobiales bacterium]|nr:hypothetical protein [Hyphomicrobiales bacterium]